MEEKILIIIIAIVSVIAYYYMNNQQENFKYYDGDVGQGGRSASKTSRWKGKYRYFSPYRCTECEELN